MAKQMDIQRKLIWLCGSLVVATAIIGCGGIEKDTVQINAPQINLNDLKAKAQESPSADAGVKVARSTAPDPRIKELAMASHYGTRPDPFALLAIESRYDKEQVSARLVAQGGGFSLEYVPPDEAPPEVIEPQPYRRLAGVMVGDSVIALIDMGDGRVQLVRPGQRIGNTEWTVVSIDLEKAIIRRPGNKKPNEVIVPLQKPLSGSIGALLGGGSGSGGSGAPGTPGGGGGSSSPGAPGAPGAE